jgi:hypothetical protein
MDKIQSSSSSQRNNWIGTEGIADGRGRLLQSKQDKNRQAQTFS